ncbi:DNA recombination protein RmuC [Novosphingobium lentum]|uniref:DNA recombination protein RmuC n=1 Tax=Novosphingobium lentum TaxID=145287 RepID=UPI00082F6805|nr:DNA recombination protein RmuC [Novosphingobium lentum]
MNPQLVTVFVLLLGLAAGAALGWFFGSRPVAEWRARHAARDGEARDLDDKFHRAITELAGASERANRADALAGELEQARGDHGLRIDALRAEHGQRLDATSREHAATVEAIRREHSLLSAQNAALKADAANFADRERLLFEAREALKKEFESAGAKVLEGAQEAFLKRAQDRFTESEKTNAERISTLLAPVGQRLASYEAQVTKLEKERVDAFGNLSGLIEGMRVGQEQIRAEAARLGNSLRNAPKARGRWGEQQLRNVLEQCGLAEHTDFVTEHSIDTDEGRLRPDAIVRVPGNKLLVIDAKVSLNAYQEAYEAQDDASRKVHLDAHAASMRNHIQTLATKSYQSQFEEAPDYVLMFVPGEHFIAAALEHDPTLWNYAFERRVLLASPTNLVAIARTVAQVWRQDGLATEAREIGRMGGELYDRLAVAAEHMKRVGAGLDSAVTNYNKFVGSFERNVLSAGKRLKDKHIEIGKREIEDIPLVESKPRYTEGPAADLAPEPPVLAAVDAANDGVSSQAG